MNARTLFLTGLLLAFLCAYQGLFADVPVKGKIQYTSAAGTNKGHLYRNAAGANLIFLKAFEQTTVNINLQGDYDTANGSETSALTKSTGSSMSSRSRMFIREASITQDLYFQNIGLDSFSLKGGVFTEKWGYTDYYNPVNIINPQDYTYFLMKDARERALGVYALKSSLYFSQFFFIEALVNPLFEPDNESSATFVHKNMRTIKTFVDAGADYTGTDYPDESLSAGSYAARTGVKTRDFEAHVMYYDGYDHASTASFSGSAANLAVTRDYNRLRMVGVDFMANFAWDINFKGEMAYYFGGKSFMLKDSAVGDDVDDGNNGNLESPLIDYTLGLEIVKNMSASAFLFNFEFNENIIIDHNSSVEEKKITNRVLGEMQYSFVKKTVIVKGAGLYCIEDGDLGAQFELGLKPETVFTIKAGYWLFQPFQSGDKGVFGAYNDQDFAYIAGEVVF